MLRISKGGLFVKRIVLTGGGTAGHVSPNQALIPLLQEEGWEIHYIGTKTGIERTLIEPMEGVTYHAVSSGKLRRYFDLKNFTDPFRVIAGAFQSMALIHRLKPNVVFSKGGFVSVPEKTIARSGVPVCTALLPSSFAHSGKVVHMALANGLHSLFASPGVMSLSCMTTGTRHSAAPKTTGTLTKPPLEKTMLGLSL